MAKKNYNVYLLYLLNIILVIFILHKLNVFNYAYFYNDPKCWELEIFHYNAGETNLTNITNKSDYIKAEPNILIVAGTHGNEPAGTVAIRKWFENIPLLNRGSITFIPAINPCGLKHNRRESPNLGPNKIGGDINRTYPFTSNSQATSKQAETVVKYVASSNYVIDFHEGYSWYRKNESSVGSTLTPNNFGNMNDISKNIINKLNETITENYKKWDVRLNMNCDIKRTLNCHCYNIQKPYFLVEITGQNNVQPIELRRDQGLTIINTFLQNLNMI
jgi:hypothetical protein